MIAATLPRVLETAPVQSLDKSLADAHLVTATALNLRTETGTEKGIIVEMPNGAKVQCYGYYTSLGSVKWFYMVTMGKPDSAQ